MSKFLIDAQSASAELLRRANKYTPQFLDGSFPLQEAFIVHPSKFKALFATRRFGKSYTGGLYLCKTAFENANATCLYIALTRDSAKRIMWRDVLKQINKKYKLSIKFNETELSAKLSNGSVIYLMGVDSSEEEKEKLLGQKYDLAVVDECASYSIDLRHLVYAILKPAMADKAGTICLLGTPGNLTKSLFFDVTTGKEPGWHVVKADTKDNPFMRERWAAEIAELTSNQPYITETPAFKQMYLGQWVVDENALVYKFNPERNVYDALPMFLNGDWQYLMGVDLGYEDDSAFAVCAYHEHDKILHFVDVFKKKHMDITDVAEKINELKRKYNIHKVTIDGANKQAVEEIKKRHHIALEVADKRGKEDFIEIMNSELILGRVKISKHACMLLSDEWSGLVWKMKDGKPVVPKKENPACDNHLSDAALYAWRFAYQYLSVAPKPQPVYRSAEWYEQQEDEMFEMALEKAINAEKAEKYDDYT